jgi:lauroyl/myristoyl acyltransferase
MQSVGVYTPERHREYFRQAGGELAGWLRLFRCSHTTHQSDPQRPPPELAAMARERFEVDQTAATLKSALASDKGVVLVGVHIASPAMWLARLCMEVPTTAYVRFSKDVRRHKIKERAFQALGLDYVMEPSDPRQRGSRISKMAEVVRQGRVMLITPDLVRKRDEGRPVRFFGRHVHLPSGAAVLSVLTGAPMMMMTARASGGRACLTFRGPFAGSVDASSPEQRESAIRERLQWFADGLEEFLRTDAPLWFLWADGRWTKVFQRDPEYAW